MEYVAIFAVTAIAITIFLNKNHPELNTKGKKSHSRIGVDLPPLPVKEKPQEPELEFQYVSAKKLFTASERSFLGVLDAAVGEKYRIMGKVRIADIISPERNMDKSSWWKLFNKVAAKHIDYVICDKDTLDIAAAVELDDSSHERKARRERDDFVNKALKAARIPLIRFKTSRTYQVEVVRTEIELGISGIKESESKDNGVLMDLEDNTTNNRDVIQ
ncbi:hypothetical protein A3759_03765 [Thalassolituus sp. HI0120]|nr:hypothetical protein A3759_03765 [Thalassolituus sp. HI0120]